MPKIKFTDITGEVAEQFYPVPAKLAIPEWLKQLSPYYDDKNFKVLGPRSSNQTAKRCVPMLDAVMSGYIIKLTHDVHVKRVEGDIYFEWPSGLGVAFHSKEEASSNAKIAESNRSIPKWMSPWSIETPRGYSTIFTPPLNSDQTAITPFSGIVDTDNYIDPVNFPFIIDPGFEGILKAGMPLIQIIPFKRETWKMEIQSGETEKIKKNSKLIVSTFKDAYRKNYWVRKDYS